MKVAVMNLSGNVGKSTIARHVLQPALPGAPLIEVETINADENSAETIKGKQFGGLMEELFKFDDAIIDVGSSNIEDFIKGMRAYEGSHEDLDRYVIPTTKERKQMRDTIGTINLLRDMGVPAKKIFVVFNRVQADEALGDSFATILDFHTDAKAFVLKHEAVLYDNELYGRLSAAKLSLDEVLSDQTDWKSKIPLAVEAEERQHALTMLALTRLGRPVKGNIERVRAAILK